MPGPFHGQPARVGDGAMFSFAMDRRTEVDAVHARAPAPGGRCEGQPGARTPDRHFAPVRDLEGNKLCASRMQ